MQINKWLIVILGIAIIGGYYFFTNGGKIGINREIKYSESCVSHCLETFDKIIAYDGYEATEDFLEDKGRVYVLDTSTNKKTIINSVPANIKGVASYENKIVWSDERKGEDNWAIYLKNITSGDESEVLSIGANKIESIKIFKDKIAYIQNGKKNNYLSSIDTNSVYLYDLNTQIKSLIADDTMPRRCLDFYDNNIVYTELIYSTKYNGQMIYPTGVNTYLYNIDKNTTTKIAEIKSESVSAAGLCPSVYKNKIAYGKDNKIYLYDIDTANTTEVVNDNFGATTSFTLHEDKLKYVQTASHSSAFDNYSNTGKCVIKDLISQKEKDVTCNGGVIVSEWFF